MTDHVPAPEPGEIIRCRRPLVAFHPEGHPDRNTHHGPLLARGTALVYVGADPRPGVHVARTPERADGEFWEVFFKLADLIRTE